MIYCVEDDAGIRELMVYTLNMAGFKARGMSDAGELYEAIREEQPELILLDIMLPGEDGISVLKKLRNSPVTSDIPVIMASARGSEYDKVIGLDCGADDYLSKPFGMMEMLSRVRAVLRRSTSKEPDGLLRAGELIMDRNRHTVTAYGRMIDLTLKEYELLQTFLQSPDIVFTRDRLLNQVWGTDFPGETRTVDVHIGTLRTKLGACGDYIRTIRGVGYKLEVQA